MDLKIYPKINETKEGLDKFLNIIKDYHGVEAQYLCNKGELNYIDFYSSIKSIVESCSDIKEITVHPPLPIYDLELLFLKDESIVFREIDDCIRVSNELGIEVNLLYHTNLSDIAFISAMGNNIRRMIEKVEGTNVTILLENIFMIKEDSMSALNICEHYDSKNLRACFDLCHAYCKAHIYKKDNYEYFDKYLDKEKCMKYVKQVHFSYTRDYDGYIENMTHGRRHDNMESLSYDLSILERYGMLDKNIVVEVNEDDRDYVARKDQLSDIKLLYEYMNKDYSRIESNNDNEMNEEISKSKNGGCMYKRILMKLSGEALSGKQGFGFDDDNARVIVRQIKDLINMNVELGLVIGGGNIWRGRENTDMDMSKSHQIGIMATVINAMYMQEILRGAGIKARVITPFEISGMAEMFEKTKVNDYLEKGEVCIFAGGIGQPFFTTDTGAVLNALKINADALFLAKNVDGVYDKDPKKYDDAVKFDKVTFSEVLDRKLGVMDLTAVILCMENNMDVVVFDLNGEGNIMKNIKGEITGTLVVNE